MISLPIRVCLLVLSVAAALRLQAQTPDAFDPQPDGEVAAIAEQADGKFLLGGSFVTISGQPHYRLVRYQADTTVDAAFAAWTDNTVRCLCVQTDGSIVLGGDFLTVGGPTRNHLGRVSTNGAADSFDPAPNGTVHCLVQQPDGKILVGGEFSNIGGQWRSLVTRLTGGGGLDPAFRRVTFGPAATVNTLALQADGRILIGGEFSGVGGEPRTNLARLNPDGTVDAAFQPPVNGLVNCLAVQPDGKILVGCSSTTPGAEPCRLTRLLPDGTVDPTFDLALDGPITSVALQSDGKVLVAGEFAHISEIPCDPLVRLQADGTLDGDFSPQPNSWIHSLGLQADGKILLSGDFNLLSSVVRMGFGRLENTEPGTQRLEYDGSHITWRQSATTPAAARATCEFSTNSTTWFPLNPGTNIAGAWQFDATAAPTNAALRARGFVSGGKFNGSSWFVECTGRAVPNTPPVILVTDGNLGFRSGHFGFNMSGPAGETVVTESSPDLVNWTACATNVLGADPCYFSDPENAPPGPRFYRLLVP